MRPMLAHVHAHLLELRRELGMLFPSLLLPAMLYLFFGTAVLDRATANLRLTAYTIFAVLGITFFQFGVGIAHERTSPWELYLRTLPVDPLVRFSARVITASLLALVASGLMVTLAHALTPARLDSGGWFRWGVALVVGSIPLALLGIAIGYWASPRAAAPLANMLYIVLAYMGSLWSPPQDLPPVIAQLSPYLPTRRYAEVMWAAALGQPWRIEDWLWLLGYAVVFGMLAVQGYRRDEGQRYQ